MLACPRDILGTQLLAVGRDIAWCIAIRVWSSRRAISKCVVKVKVDSRTVVRVSPLVYTLCVSVLIELLCGVLLRHDCLLERVE